MGESLVEPGSFFSKQNILLILENFRKV